MLQTVAAFDTPSTSHFVLPLAVLFVLMFPLTVAQTSNLHWVPTKGHKTTPTWHCCLQTELSLISISVPHRNGEVSRECQVSTAGRVPWRDRAAAGKRAPQPDPRVTAEQRIPIVGSISHGRGASAFLLLPAPSSRQLTSDQGAAAHMCSYVLDQTPSLRSLLGALN